MRYFFDINDGDTLLRDDAGLELDNDGEARYHAVDALPDIAREKLPDGDRRDLVVKVRDSSGRNILTAMLSLRVTWEGATEEPVAIGT